MKKIVIGCYAAGVVMVIAMLLYINSTFGVYEEKKREDVGFEYVNAYEKTVVRDDSAPQGIVEEYRWNLAEISQSGECVAFYAVHQNTEVYVDGQLLLKVYPKKTNRFGKTAGCYWPITLLYEEDQGKEICIRLTPVYKSAIGKEPVIYFGSKVRIVLDILFRSMPIFLLGSVAIIIGAAFMIFVVINMKNTQVDKSIFMLGWFSAVVGLWKLADLQAAPLFPVNPIMLSYAAILALYLILIPYICFVREHFHRDYKVWDIVSILNLLTMGMALIVQFLGIADVRETLAASHIILGIAIIAMVIATLVEALRYKMGKKLKLICFSLIFLVAGAATDCIIFYLKGNSGTMLYALIGFLVYIIIMGVSSIIETKRLMDIGMKAKQFQDMAFHDELTTLYNRRFFAEYTDGEDFDEKNSGVIMLDVNNLKKCNDSRGHEQGDCLLKDSAEAIDRVFGTIGKCCRIGGDEFCVVLEKKEEDKVQKMLEALEQLEEERNRKYPERFPLQIAYGYAPYSQERDYNFNDTMRRADHRMYQRKIQMKSNT